MSECIPVEIRREDFWPKVAIGAQSAAMIGSDGQLRMSGGLLQSSDPDYDGWEVIQPGQSWRMVAAETDEVRYAAIRADGTMWAWGLSLGLYPVQVGTDTDWVHVHIAYYERSLALKADGTLWSWGSGYAGQLGHGGQSDFAAPTQVGTDADWAWIGGIDVVSYAKKTDGTLWACGWNRDGRVNGNSAGANVLTLTLVAEVTP